MADYKLFSGDSHVSEPPDLWLKRIDKKFRYRAPYVESREKDDKLQDFMIYEGYPPHPVSIGLAAAASKQGNKAEFQVRASRYEEALPGGWDPVERLKDQDIDGVEGEVLHPTLGFRLFWLRDPELQRAVFRVYNDWLGEFISYNPQRLVGVALISLYDIQEAVKELRRAAKLGHRGAMIWLSPPPDRPPYSSPEYDPFWAEAQELEMPIVLHAITGHAESRLSIAYWNPEMTIYPVVRHHEADRTLAHLICSGVLERFPRLKFIVAENGIDWIPQSLARMDRAMKAGTRGIQVNVWPTELSLKPSEYFRRQVYVGFIDEPEAVPMRHEIGVDNMMWASDYPHFASTWPKSQEFIDKAFQGVAEDEKRKMVRDNTRKLYKLAEVAQPVTAD